jgi:putative SOS response-associated peptidase YedK
MVPVHDRMPAVQPPALWERWLDPSTPVDEAIGLLERRRDVELVTDEVGAGVGNARDNYGDWFSWCLGSPRMG